MRIAVLGGTGVGRHVVHQVQQAGHEAVVLARSRGVDVATARALTTSWSARTPWSKSAA
jgi:uncharacterized protein YbjT (DUF2867 family)